MQNAVLSTKFMKIQLFTDSSITNKKFQLITNTVKEQTQIISPRILIISLSSENSSIINGGDYHIVIYY